MILYHGSKQDDIKSLQPKQAKAKEGLDVPEGELQKGVYLTPDFELALVVAARPKGATHIDKKTRL